MSCDMGKTNNKNIKYFIGNSFFKTGTYNFFNLVTKKILLKKKK